MSCKGCFLSRKISKNKKYSLNVLLFVRWKKEEFSVSVAILATAEVELELGLG